MKKCNKCNKVKPFSSFYKASGRAQPKDGHRKSCKGCAKIYAILNKEHKRVYDKVRRGVKKEEIREYYRTTYSCNVKHLAKKRHKEACRLHPQMLVPWADEVDILTIYESAVLTSQVVDHIYPINSSWVCGLHVTENLQLLSGSKNSSKRNRYLEEYHER